MTDVRPLPRLDEPDSGEFWRTTSDKVLKYQQCSQCGKVIWYPRPHCTTCIEGELVWHTSAGTGSIYSFSVVRQSYHPFFRNLVPYAVAYVDLDEGFRMLSNITGVEDPTTDLQIGQRVQLVWEEHESLNVPLFAPVAE